MESPRGHGSSHGEDGDLPPSPEAARMLREMGRREGEEPDLPDELLRSNNQLQQDEMLALEAIYGDKIRIFYEKARPRSFQIQVHCEIPDGISVSIEPSQDGDDHHEPNIQLLDNFSVKHLAPLSPTCLMPPSYPSHHPPYLTLGVQWLDNEKAPFVTCSTQSGHNNLDKKVVYEWVQWLQSYTLSHLSFDDGIVIRQPDDSMVGPVDVRVVGEILSVKDVVQRLISYNEEQCHESFLRSLHACMICFSEYTDGKQQPPLVLGMSG